MKKIYLIITLGLFLGSCKKFLEPVSPINVEISKAYTDENSIKQGLVGVYASMQSPYYYGGHYLLIADALADNVTTGGYQNPVLDEIGAKAVSPSNTITAQMFVAIYNTIAHANDLLAGIDKLNIDASKKAPYIAQAKALRALAHFDLLRYFGQHWDLNSKVGIPIINSVTNFNNKPTRNTVAEVYNFVISDLLAAETDAGVATSNNFIGTNAINALLARVYLYKGDKIYAAKYANLVINSGNYSFLDNPSKIYNTRNSNESIFELYFDQQSQSSYNTFTYSRADALKTELLYLSAADLNTFFGARPGDSRALLHDFSLDNNNSSITANGDGRTQKYRGETQKDNPAYVIRLAEMYLIKSEAEGTMHAINALRSVRGLEALNDLSGDDFTNAILDERRAELNFEGHRYFDLVRTNKYANLFGVEAFRMILPLPSNEILASDNKLTQAPGY